MQVHVKGILVLLVALLVGGVLVSFVEIQKDALDPRLPGRAREFVRVRIPESGYVGIAEVADTNATRARGLSERPSLPTDRGMLLVFDEREFHGIWMRGMRFSIDLVWISGDRVVGTTRALPVIIDGPLPVFHPPEPVDAVLEVPAGTVERHGIVVGQRVDMVS